MRFDILTLFPEMFPPVLESSIIGRAIKNGILEINYVNIRDFANNKHNRVDDYPYGGGCGMVMQAMPIYNAYKSIVDNLSYKPLTIFLSPQGKVFNQQIAVELKKEKHIILICGHYEGIDERVIELICDMELSIGDFVLTGGEIPAMTVIDCISRLIPGVLSDEMSYIGESHYSALLEYPQYTRPEVFMDKKVPEVLLSGHHKNIENWRREQSIIRTAQKRPELLKKAKINDKEKKLADTIIKNK